MNYDPSEIREKLPVVVFDDPSEVSISAAREIADLILEHRRQGRKTVLGLPTGSTPIGVYEELVRLHREEGFTFADVETFNLDEYYPMHPGNLQSYNRFMHEWLFDFIDIPAEHIHIPDGTIPEEDVAAFCESYEKTILEKGGLDLILLGIGRTGHIGFNEPGSPKTSRTRIVRLDKITRIDAAGDFFGEENVPRRALTMGVGTILSAKKHILIAFGEQKAGVLAQAIEGPVSSGIAASFLQECTDAKMYIDRAAAADLTRFKAPWLLGKVTWDPRLVRKAVIWLAERVQKPILKLTDEDYNEFGLQALSALKGAAYDVNIEVFRGLQGTISGWPGGKPEEKRLSGNSGKSRNEAGDDIFPKRIVVFSPHPDDDVISMGGTLIRLADQGHEVHVAYQTSGNIAVFDHDALRFADFVTAYNHIFDLDPKSVSRIEGHIEEFLRHKKPGQADSPEVLRIKGLIRRGESRAAARACGIPLERLHFLDLPFYETGQIRKRPVGEEDYAILVKLLREIQPHQIYAAGDLSDPHGTHRVCLNAISEAIGRVKKDTWFRQCRIWLYRGAWQEWGLDEITMAVPLSPAELLRKRTAILRHRSQKDKALFPGTDNREFWQRAEDRNRKTAMTYDKMGLAEYEAIEAFVEWSYSS